MAWRKRTHGQADGLDSENLLNALELLLRARNQAIDAGIDIWQLAVEVDELKECGLRGSDLRWLLARGFAIHRHEVERRGITSREFENIGKFQLTNSTCFVLTPCGQCFLECSLHGVDETAEWLKPSNSSHDGEQVVRAIKPHWEINTQILFLGQVIVKEFHRPAVNQQTVLTVFEEEDWPPRIDDPLPRTNGCDHRHRLHDTVRSLNHRRIKPILEFHSDGCGEGVCWKIVSTGLDN